MSGETPTHEKEMSQTEDEFIIENPRTGERIKFFDEPTSSGGDMLRFEFWARPHIVGPAAHIHPK